MDRSKNLKQNFKYLFFTNITMKTFTITLIFSLIFSIKSLAQTTVKSRVQEPSGKHLSFVSVGLHNTDMSLVKATVSDEQGVFVFDKVKVGKYLLTATAIGYQKEVSKVFEVENTSLELVPLVLHETTTALKEVSVSTKKPFIEQALDRTIVNVANSIIGSGSTALEVLTKAPGVTVDFQKEQVELRGKEGVMVQIDGKQSYLSGADLVGMLRAMSSDNIDKIEIITNPSAKYDAAGNAGIINIRLKKNTNLGTNGLFTLGLGSGVHFRSRSSLALNHRTKNLNIFGNYSANKGGNFFDLALEREQPDGNLRNIVAQHTHLVFDVLGQNAKAGVDYFINKNTTIGVVWTGLWTTQNEAGLSSFNARRSTEQPIYSEASTQKTFDIVSQNQLANINFQHIFKNKSQLSVDADYGYFEKNADNTLKTSVIKQEADATKLTPELLNQTKTNIEIKTFKADYNINLSKSWRFESGIKYANIVSKNDVKLESGELGNLILDSNLSSYFTYNEQVNAGYVNFTGKINKADVQAGLRAEHTHSIGRLTVPNQTKVRDYLNWFPSVFISKPLSDKQTLIFSYSYRIDRPNYQNINPARGFIDLFAYSVGNIDLKPQYTHALELRYALKSGFFGSLAANYITGLILSVNNVSEGNKVYRSSQNFGDSKGYILTLSQPISVNKAWQMQTTLLGYYTQFQFDFEGKSFSAKNISSRLNVNNGFVLPGGWSAELNGWVNSPSVMTIMESPWLSNVDAGLQKTVAKKLKLKLSLQNIFNMPLAKNTMTGNYSLQTARLMMDTRILMLNASYPFGNQQVKSARQRRTGSEDESKRAN
jgi:Outer membrane protein beta-barrel family/Carboxypeptidase regulatory-like domain